MLFFPLPLNAVHILKWRMRRMCTRPVSPKCVPVENMKEMSMLFCIDRDWNLRLEKWSFHQYRAAKFDICWCDGQNRRWTKIEWEVMFLVPGTVKKGKKFDHLIHRGIRRGGYRGFKHSLWHNTTFNCGALRSSLSFFFVKFRPLWQQDIIWVCQSLDKNAFQQLPECFCLNKWTTTGSFTDQTR